MNKGLKLAPKFSCQFKDTFKRNTDLMNKGLKLKKHYLVVIMPSQKKH